MDGSILCIHGNHLTCYTVKSAFWTHEFGFFFSIGLHGGRVVPTPRAVSGPKHDALGLTVPVVVDNNILADRTRQINIVCVQGDARIVRQNHDQNSDMIARINYPEEYPCYDDQRGANGRRWFLIWVDRVWGWITEGVSTLER